MITAIIIPLVVAFERIWGFDDTLNCSLSYPASLLLFLFCGSFLRLCFRLEFRESVSVGFYGGFRFGFHVSPSLFFYFIITYLFRSFNPFCFCKPAIFPYIFPRFLTFFLRFAIIEVLNLSFFQEVSEYAFIYGN